MIEILKSVLFGIVEGITEWLPISLSLIHMPRRQHMGHTEQLVISHFLNCTQHHQSHPPGT